MHIGNIKTIANMLLAAVIDTKFKTHNMNEERKQKLIEALKSERLRFAERGQDTTEHDIAIQFLLLGKTSCNPDKWELLDAVMNDFDTVCSDYGC